MKVCAAITGFFFSHPIAIPSATRSSYKMLPDSVTAISGAIAAIGAKVSLFPMDTIKTRLQAPGGLFAHGGFRGVYKGVGAIAAGSPPLGTCVPFLFD